MESELELEEPHPDFVKGFNQGYILAQHEPELAEKLATAMGQTERGQGFQGGRAEYLQEKSREQSRLPGWLAEGYYQTLNDEQDKSIGPNKDGTAPEKD